MRRMVRFSRHAALALALVSLAACGQGVEPSLARGDTMPWSFGPSWGGMRPEVPAEALTVMRIRGDAPPAPTLFPQEGNVWPDPEGPRATLANPEEALRGIPPRMPDLRPAPLPSPAGGFLPRLPDAPRPLPPMPSAGQVIPTPTGPRVTTGGPGNVQGTVGPGGQIGTAIRDGATTTIIEPGRPPQIVPTPR